MATIVTINASDQITNSRADLNTNFTNLNSDKIETSYIDTDTALAANSDTKIPSQKAVKTYIDTSGGANASETVRGVVEEATDAEVLAGTATGGTGAKLFVTPAKFQTNLGALSVTADEDITIGAPVGISNYITGTKVARALRTAATETIAYTMEGSVGAKNSLSFPIGGEKFVFLGTQASDDSLYATVGTVTPGTKTIALGTPVAATADVGNSTDYIAGCKLDTDKFIVFYREDASTTIVKYRVATVSGSVITFGTAATFFTGGTASDYIVCDQISTDKGIVFIECATLTDSRLVCFTTSGTTATAGTPKALGTTIDDAIGSSAVKTIGTDKFIFVTTTGGVTSNLCQVGTVTGTTTITLGTETAWSTTDSLNQNVYVVSPGSNVAVIQAQTGGSSPIIVACTVSGTTPTFGAEIAGTQYDASLYAESSTVILSSNYNSASIRKYTLSGNTLTSSGQVIQTLTAAVPYTFVPIDSGYWITIDAQATTLKYAIQGMSNTFLGIAQSTVSRGATLNVKYSGVDANQSGLIPGALYLVSSSGLTLSTSVATVNSADDRYLVALSATQILI